jgi:hypothetical protein
MQEVVVEQVIIKLQEVQEEQVELVVVEQELDKVEDQELLELLTQEAGVVVHQTQEQEELVAQE